ncbi:ImmA/IrrE family metallo-endopeptidase [Rhodoblastus acidophilus]|uniref:ImmA/IrrE family metallo-endopeptidase n=1 Tax=Rhodoblastus acidophilus TaxID=1074 RepID=A0A6N8DH25_RHOAC|nr:ImmA/IrrE family metallo-endopeptidase [Rhodoblastus acidophilus]MCW2272731.1 Zn-dependent peptidase ImmA (M78 family) [Rhodoblastus acidophilus]MTV29642.1 ImmA/IrrE family metallo-endopeptidase [Rhodoblastus acidophilus]
MSHFNASVFKAVLEARNQTIKSIAARLEQHESDLAEQLRSDEGPKRSTLAAMARELAVPTFVFYMDEAPPLRAAIPDFRLETPTFRANSRETLEAIEVARRVQEIAIENKALCSLDVEGQLTPFNVIAFAKQVRKYLKITALDQKNAKDARAFYYICRQKIEANGVFVLQDSFPSEEGSGFCLSDKRAPVIVVNTKNQNASRRLFTLIHELAHVILAQTGISDPFIRRNPVEALCNRFAAAFLLPKSLCDEVAADLGISQTADRDTVARAAKKLKASQQATVLRFEQLAILDKGSYINWLSLVRASGNPDYITQGFGIGRRAPEEKFKLAKYGFCFAKVFSRALSRGDVSPIEIYRACGLKPKWQRPYFELASTALPTDMED